MALVEERGALLERWGMQEVCDHLERALGKKVPPGNLERDFAPKGLPAHVEQLKRGRLWLRVEVEEFAERLLRERNEEEAGNGT